MVYIIIDFYVTDFCFIKFAIKFVSMYYATVLDQI